VSHTVELRRLASGLGSDDDQQRPFLVRARFTVNDAAQVIADVRAVLRSVVERVPDWPPFEQWPGLLVPVRFVQRCAPETVPDPAFDVEGLA
jgi:hypothetical protein